MSVRHKKRVVVAMSGGVDSSTAAALLKEEGHEVIGVSMQLYDQAKLETSRFDSCCSLKEVDIVKRVCQTLDIPYYILNFEKIFKEKVVDYFVGEYLNARTPNPCVKCNDEVKFKHLILKAKELKADYLATGHYVKNVYNDETKEYQLRKAKDPKKDQSYFLFGIDKKELPFLRFPLGELEKPEVRRIAERHHLPNAKKEESMEICFIPDNNYSAFIENSLSGDLSKYSGNFITKKGKALSKHDGAYHYTVGQRKGLGLSNADPLYVLNVDPISKDVTVGNKEELMATGLVAKNMNWLSRPLGSNISARIRHGIRDIKCHLDESWKENLNKNSTSSSEIKISFDAPQRAVTPGQAVVLYEEDVLLGGGWIERALH